MKADGEYEDGGNTLCYSFTIPFGASATLLLPGESEPNRPYTGTARHPPLRVTLLHSIEKRAPLPAEPFFLFYWENHPRIYTFMLRTPI